VTLFFLYGLCIGGVFAFMGAIEAFRREPMKSAILTAAGAALIGLAIYLSYLVGASK
jgi:hypothetical protein